MTDKTVFDAVRESKKLRNENVAFLSMHGSRAYATASESSDYDVKGIFIASADELFGLNPVGIDAPSINGNVHFGKTSADFEVHELGKFFKLLTKSNPNMLEYIFAPTYMSWIDEDDLLAIRNLANGCVTKLLYNAYIGMFEKNKPEFYKKMDEGNACYDTEWKSFTREKKVVDAKALLVMLRSLLSCYHVLLTREVEMDMRKTSRYARKVDLYYHLLGLKRGEVELDIKLVYDEMEHLKGMVDDAYEESILLDKVPVEVVEEMDAFLKDIRFRTVCK